MSFHMHTTVRTDLNFDSSSRHISLGYGEVTSAKNSVMRKVLKLEEALDKGAIHEYFLQVEIFGKTIHLSCGVACKIKLWVVNGKNVSTATGFMDAVESYLKDV